MWKMFIQSSTVHEYFEMHNIWLNRLPAIYCLLKVWNFGAVYENIVTARKLKV